MPINLDTIGARPLADALLNPAIFPHVTLTASAAGEVVFTGSVAIVARSENTLRIRGYDPAIVAPFAIDKLAIEYGNLSVRADLAGGDYAFVAASPQYGYFIEFLLSVALPASAPTLSDAAYARSAKTSAQVASESADVAVAAKNTAVNAATTATAKATEATNDAGIAQTKAAEATTSATTAGTKATQATADAATAATAKSSAQASAAAAAAALAGMVVAAPNSVAGDNQVSRGDDIRFAMSGGIKGTPVATSGGKFVQSSGVAMPTGTDDFEFHCWWKACPASEVPSGTGDVITFQNLGLVVARYATNHFYAGVDGVAAGVGTGAAYIVDGAWYYIRVSRAGSTLKLWLNGILIGTDAAFVQDLGTNKSRPGTDFDWVVSSTIHSFRWFNRALTVAEAARPALAEPPASLACSTPGRTPTVYSASGYSNSEAVAPASDWGKFRNQFSGSTVQQVSFGANYVEYTSYTGQYSIVGPSTPKIAPGQEVEVTFTKSGLGFESLSLRVGAPYYGTTGTSLIGLPDGTYTYTIKNDSPLEAYAVQISGYVASGARLTDLSFKVKGTVEYFPPQQVSAVGNWRGVFGGILVAQSGITPLAPEYPRPRHTIGVFRLATPAVISGPSYVTQTRQSNPGKLRLTFPSWMWNQLQVKAQSGLYLGGPCLMYGDTTHSSGHLDLYCWGVQGTPGLANEDIAWESSHLE